jgi:polyhydroxybutyrate depolymerase
VTSTRNETKWIVVGGVLVVVAIAAIVVLTMSVLAGRDGTDEVDSTTSTSSTVSVVPTTASTPTPPTEPDDIVVERVAVPAGLLERSYTVISPKGSPPDAELPVVVALHGLGVDAAAMSTAADWRGAVAEHDFIAVFPQGMANSWNVGPCCPPSNLVGTDDAAFLGQVIDQVLSRDDTDAERLYLTGFSNGALMTYSYACANPGTFAAVAPMSGSNVTGCSPSEPLSLLHQHSDPDLVVPFNGGLGLGVLVSSAPFPDVPGSVAAWAAADGCAAEPERTVAEDGVERWVWGGCSAGTTVELVKIPAVGHVWPRTATYDGLDELLRFFDLA